MSETEYYKSLKRDLIPKLLAVIETHGVDMMHAENIPMFLQKAIEHSNFEHHCETKFKAYSMMED